LRRLLIGTDDDRGGLQEAGHVGNVAQKLRKRPETVKELRLYQDQVEKIPLLGIEIAPLDLRTVLSAAVRPKYGLMTNDSLIAATA